MTSMRAIAGSSGVEEGSKAHMLNLKGEYITGHVCLSRVGFRQDASGVSLKIASRSSDDFVTGVSLASIR